MLWKNLLIFCNIATIVIVAIADALNKTHLFNPSWPGHARFHIGMQFTTLLLMTAVSLFVLLRKRVISQGELAVGALAPATFWPGLFVAYIIPGTDIYATEELRQLGIPINLVLAAVFLLLTLLSWYKAAQKTSRTVQRGTGVS
ncbi:MAG TPA: hypothetical protein V6D03_00010 [Candidatus Caenarcaniphilales bacterium]